MKKTDLNYTLHQINANIIGLHAKLIELEEKFDSKC